MIATAKRLSNAQVKTLRTMIARGGEMNSYAGQPDFYCNSLGPLKRMGLIESVSPCSECAEGDGRQWENETCQRPLAGQKGGGRCYQRVRVTDAGRCAIGTED